MMQILSTFYLDKYIEPRVKVNNIVIKQNSAKTKLFLIKKTIKRYSYIRMNGIELL